MKILSLRVCLPVAVLLSSLCANAAPGAVLEQYHQYLKLFREYAVKAAQ